MTAPVNLSAGTAQRVNRWAAVALARQAEEALSAATAHRREAERETADLTVAAALAVEADRRARASGHAAAQTLAADVLARVRRAAEGATAARFGRPFVPPFHRRGRP